MNIQKLSLLIRKLVKEEVKKTLKPMVNEILANKYMNVISEEKQGSSVRSVFSEVTTPTQETNGYDPDLVRQQREEVRKKLAARLSDGNEMMEMIYEDVSPISSASSQLGYAEDDDDDGVDISQFGF